MNHRTCDPYVVMWNVPRVPDRDAVAFCLLPRCVRVHTASTVVAYR